MKRYLIALSVALGVGTQAGAEMMSDITLEHKKDNVMADANEIIEMRSALARTFIRSDTGEITEDTFKKVCGAVAKRVKEMTEKEGVTIRHAAIKNRNPKNAATPEETKTIRMFQKDKGMKELWEDFTVDGKRQIRYTKPIYVEKACLACHGEKDSRPAFIKEKYPDDKAYGFKAGDLRGIISVTAQVD